MNFDPKSLTFSSTSGPQVSIQDVSKGSVSFILSNVDLALANSLRRCILAEVPSMAIDLVEIGVNTVNNQYSAGDSLLAFFSWLS